MPRYAAWLPGAVLAAGCVLVTGQREQLVMPLAAPLTSIPQAMFAMPGHDVTIDDEQRRVAGMSDYVYRVFRRDSLDVFSVYVGYYDYQRQGKSIHSPKNCLPGGGWEPMSQSVQSVTVDGRSHLVNRYLLGKGPARALVYYWYQGRGRIESNEYRVKWDLLRDAALSGRTEEALVRLVIPVAPDFSGYKGQKPVLPDEVKKMMTMPQADSLAQRAAVQLIPEVMRVLPKAPSAT
ncbi:MAG: EpsI family protein [Gemmatimonadetes bacterium]|nr:EpsI family protein [Gemmatimonadota bacterium]